MNGNYKSTNEQAKENVVKLDCYLLSYWAVIKIRQNLTILSQIPPIRPAMNKTRGHSLWEADARADKRAKPQKLI